MSKIFAGGYWKKSTKCEIKWPRRMPDHYRAPDPLLPKKDPDDDIFYWISRCLDAESKLEDSAKRITALETRIAELKMDRDLIARYRPVSRTVSYTEQF